MIPTTPNIAEEEFGDRFHVRGLTGVLQCTENYLGDYPFYVFLQLKICLTDSVTVRGNVLRCDDLTTKVCTCKLKLLPEP